MARKTATITAPVAPKAPMTPEEVMAKLTSRINDEIESLRYSLARQMESRVKAMTVLATELATENDANETLGSCIWHLSHSAGGTRTLYEEVGELSVWVAVADRLKTATGLSPEELISDMIRRNTQNALMESGFSDLSSTDPFSNAINVCRGVGRQRARRDVDTTGIAFEAMLKVDAVNPIIDHPGIEAAV